MLERRYDLLDRLVCSNSFARMLANFAESPLDTKTEWTLFPKS
jgi:hypothetical protein